MDIKCFSSFDPDLSSHLVCICRSELIAGYELAGNLQQLKNAKNIKFCDSSNWSDFIVISITRPKG